MPRRKDTPLVKQPTKEPTEKTKAAPIGAGVVAALLAVADGLGIDLSAITDKPIVVAILAGVGAFIAAYSKRERLGFRR